MVHLLWFHSFVLVSQNSQILSYGLPAQAQDVFFTEVGLKGNIFPFTQSTDTRLNPNEGTSPHLWTCRLCERVPGKLFADLQRVSLGCRLHWFNHPEFSAIRTRSCSFNCRLEKNKTSVLWMCKTVTVIKHYLNHEGQK